MTVVLMQWYDTSIEALTPDVSIYIYEGWHQLNYCNTDIIKCRLWISLNEHFGEQN